MQSQDLNQATTTDNLGVPVELPLAIIEQIEWAELDLDDLFYMVLTDKATKLGLTPWEVFYDSLELEEHEWSSKLNAAHVQQPRQFGIVTSPD